MVGVSLSRVSFFGFTCYGFGFPFDVLVVFFDIVGFVLVGLLNFNIVCIAKDEEKILFFSLSLSRVSFLDFVES